MLAARGQLAARVVRVLPDVVALAKPFDYLVPSSFEGTLAVGSSVRVALHHRRVAGWVVEDGVEAPEGVELQPVLAVRGVGPPASVVSLARWAAWRWAGAPARLLRTASAPTLVRALPAPPARLAAPKAPSGAAAEVAGEALRGGCKVVRLAPAHDPLPVVHEAASRLADPKQALAGAAGGVLVLAPSHSMAARLATRLRRAGHPVALLPDQWAMARAGGCIAVGTRAAALAPLPRLLAAVVLDAHDEAYTEERQPTWSAWQMVAERARRDGAPCALVSACPTLALLEAAPLVATSRLAERLGWPPVDVVDRRSDDPRTGLYSPRLVDLVRWAASNPDRRVLCVLNRTGRVRLLACGACGELARCERCGGALELRSDDHGASLLHCGHCGGDRPVLCASCGSARLKALRVGVSRVREELEALAGCPVEEVAGLRGADDTRPGAAVVVGTEAVLHRVRSADAVALVDLDSELLAPRLAAGEQALALLARAARVVSRSEAPPAGADRAPGRLLLQTRLPDHPVARAAALADPELLAEAERPLRRQLGLPPYSAMAAVSGPGADEYCAAVRVAAAALPSVTVGGPVGGVWSVRAPDHGVLCDLLASVPRPAGRLRVEVDPTRA